MRRPELSPRLRMVGNLVPEGARLADIGTDHAYLPAALLLEGKIPRAIAADLRPGPLDRARATAHQYGCTGQMEFRLCDGLSGIRPEEVDAVVIAGMGGETIASILERAPWVRGSGAALILQPMSAQPELRRWLWRNGYGIAREKLCREGEKLYVALLVSDRPGPPLTAAEEWAGRQDREQPLRGAYLDSLVRKASRALAGHRRAAEPDAEVVDRLRTVLAGLLEMKGELEHGETAGH